MQSELHLVAVWTMAVDFDYYQALGLTRYMNGATAVVTQSVTLLDICIRVESLCRFPNRSAKESDVKKA